MNRAAGLALLTSLACAADLPIGPELRSRDFVVTLSRYSVPQMSASSGISEADFTARTDIRGEGIVITFRVLNPQIIGAVFAVETRRGNEAWRAQQYCRAALHFGTPVQCLLQTGPLDAVTDLKIYPAVMSRVPVEIQ
jgi:hypothetical protein